MFFERRSSFFVCNRCDFGMKWGVRLRGVMQILRQTERWGIVEWVVALALGVGSAARGEEMARTEEGRRAFVATYCVGCHSGAEAEAKLDLGALKWQPGDAGRFQTWVKVHDRVAAAEMPPKDAEKRPGPAEAEAFAAGLRDSLTAAELEKSAAEGRSGERRLNRYEYENALRDLFAAPWLEVKEQLPEDGETNRFNKSAPGLDVSHVHLARYMAAAEYAMREVLAARYIRPETKTTRHWAREETSLTKFWPSVFTPNVERLTFPVLGTSGQPEVRAKKAPITVGDKDPATREQEAVGWVHGNYVTGFGSPWRNFRAPVAGRYRVRFCGYTIWVAGGGHNQKFAGEKDKVGTPGKAEWYHPDPDKVSGGRRYEPITVYAKGGAQNRRVGAFDVETEPTVADVGEVWLQANEYLVTDACRFFRSRPGGPVPFQNPLATKEGMPGVAFRWMEVDGPIYDEQTDAGYRLLFADLPLRKVKDGASGVVLKVPTREKEDGTRRPEAARTADVAVEVVPGDAVKDGERLLRAFMGRAYRRPVDEGELRRYLALVRDQMAKGADFTSAMLTGYTAVLCSPGFLFVEEKPGRLDEYALATRLALFLWNSPPDEALRGRADRGELGRPAVLASETERMLADPRAGRFVNAFLDYWLDLRKIDDTTPSTTLYNDYYLDDALEEAALAETRLYFDEMLRKDLPARNIVDSDFTYLNDRLAAHYGVPGVKGIAMRRVGLPEDSVRGGFMTQASVLKVTANGTTTSPVLRGKWITERIFGQEISPPPPTVVAVEPDIRGAVTIRQQLDKHRADASCAVCHVKMDPPGFALESFDVMGGWRDRYRGAAEDKAAVKGWGMNGWPYAFHYALPVDCAGQLPDGREFGDVRAFKKLLLTDERTVARAFVKQLVVYATGAAVRFSDRPQVEAILDAAKGNHYGIRSMVAALVRSDLFLNK